MLKQKRILSILLFILIGLLVVNGSIALAQDDPQPSVEEGSPFHPAFPLLDADGANVLESGKPVSTMATCGACHDAEFIAGHSFHADAGLNAFGAAGAVANGRSWDTSPGFFGKWNPITYGYLSPQGDEIVDLTTPEWLQLFGSRHAGGGPAVTSRGGRPLAVLTARADDVQTSVHDPATGELTAWDWSESGTVEMNCFLCHLTNPDNAARTAVLQSGEFGWANTATLAQTGVVTRSNDGWTWNPDAFDVEGNVKLAVQDPTNENCGACHGVVHNDNDTPLTIDELALADFSTLTTGQIMSP
ncbi:MAG: hypothetical protein ACE5EY_07970 [Anaerolineae bacterium]